MTTALCIMLGILVGTNIIISIRIHNVEHTIYKQMNDIIHCMGELTNAVKNLKEDGES